MLDCLPLPLCPGFSTHRQLGTAYVSATTGAVATALGLKSLTKVNDPISWVPSPPSSASSPITLLSQPTGSPNLSPEFFTTPLPSGPLNDIFPSSAPAPTGWQICALCSCGSCKLHQHPFDEAEVSGPDCCLRMSAMRVDIPPSCADQPGWGTSSPCLSSSCWAQSQSDAGIWGGRTSL